MNATFLRIQLQRLLTFLIPGILASASLVHAEPTIKIPLGVDSGYFCVATTGGPSLVRERFTGLAIPIQFDLAMRAINSRIRYLNALKAVYRLSRNRAALSKVNLEISQQLDWKMQIRNCENGSLFPAPGPFADACHVVSGTDLTSNDIATLQIVNGAACSPGDSPVVRVYSLNSGGGVTARCSGVAISPRVIVSSAHCFAGFTSTVRIVSGIGTFVTKSFERHSGFSFRNDPFEMNDIAAIAFTEDLPLQTVGLIRANYFTSGERVIIAGYGRDESGTSDIFRAGDMRLESFTSAVIYAAYDGTLSNTCNGDSGGPLLVYREGAWLLAGIVSSGLLSDCGVGDIASFTNLGDPSNLEFLEKYLDS